MLPGSDHRAPAAQRGQWPGPGSYVGRSSCQSARSGYDPARRRRGERRASAAAVDHDRALDDLATHRLDRRDHREQRAAGREDVVDEEDPLAGLDAEAAPELALRRTIGAAHLFGEDAADADLAGRLEGQDQPAGGRARDQVDLRRAVVATTDPAAQ